jgi:hypothetical protein
MSERRTIYAVSSGAYSDYVVHGLFLDKADAVAVVERLNTGGDHWFVEEFPLYPSGDRSLRRADNWRAAVQVKYDGSIGKSWTSSEVYLGDNNGPMHPISEASTLHWTNGELAGWHVAAYGLSKEQAEKAARERAAQVAALVIEGVDPVQAERERTAS